MLQKRIVLTSIFCFFISLQAQGQNAPDTLYYELKAEMIDQARIHKDDREELNYYTISIRLKKGYRSELEELTEENVGNFLAVVYEGEIIHPTLPTIRAKLTGEHISLLGFKTEQKAKEVIKKILNKDE